ncbi:hypothetical protein SD70_13920 [Gordoniibacillus kamchatkensis]|uniref:Gfo/Idh/MocA family oxidoreductase n=1 Tax=Gordoniibacillus kamchatkensis TaxID=1590651 RepID=A0ABR5AHC6_9BACL|nr:Gfo/Idh/MocA family oxidoreductase [Paenibacillus sp. VKM B-2647]KIL40340.1 hypothetical protein SD70_13920 [Paenibacillus sp. VKM B-2647]
MAGIRLGIIGLGRFAELHARIYMGLPQVQVTALCDNNPERLARFKEWFPQARCYNDWSEMLQSQNFDAVDVLTPEHLHVEPVRAALRAGAHVFVEKPLAHTPQAAAELVREAEACGRLLMAGHVLRFDPRYAAVKRRLAVGTDGLVRSIYARRNNGKAYFHLYNRISPIFILGIHDIDLMHWYLEDDVREVHAVQTFPAGSAAPDQIWAMLRFAKGAVGIVECNWLLPGGAPSFQDVRMEITAEEGSIQVLNPEVGVMFTGAVKPDIPAFVDGYELHGHIGGSLAAELAHFAECAASGKRSDILRAEDALRAVRVAWAIDRSAKLGRPVELASISALEDEAP